MCISLPNLGTILRSEYKRWKCGPCSEARQWLVSAKTFVKHFPKFYGTTEWDKVEENKWEWCQRWLRIAGQVSRVAGGSSVLTLALVYYCIFKDQAFLVQTPFCGEVGFGIWHSKTIEKECKQCTARRYLYLWCFFLYKYINVNSEIRNWRTQTWK